MRLSSGVSRESAQRIAANFGAPASPKRETVRARKVLVRRAERTAPSSASAATLNICDGNLSSRDLSPASARMDETVIEERFSLSFEVDQEFMELLEKAKRFDGAIRVSDILKRSLQDYVTRREPQHSKKLKDCSVTKESRGFTRANSARPNPRGIKPTKRSRYITRAVKQAVRSRDGNRCSFSAAGRRCCEKRRLQFDHVLPFSLGGTNTVDNLRLMCPAHNRLAAERIFGRRLMQKRSRRAKHFEPCVMDGYRHGGGA